MAALRAFIVACSGCGSPLLCIKRMEAGSASMEGLANGFPLLELPDDIQVVVLSNLPLSDLLLNVAPVCRHLSWLCQENRTWMALFVHRWGPWTLQFDNVFASTRDCFVDEDSGFSIPRLTESETMKDEDDDGGADERPKKERKQLSGEAIRKVSGTSKKEPADWQDRYRFFLAGHWLWFADGRACREIVDVSGRPEAGDWLMDTKTVSSVSVKKRSMVELAWRRQPGLQFPELHLLARQSLQIPGVISQLARCDSSIGRHAELQISSDQRLHQLWQMTPGEYRFEIHIFEKEAEGARGTPVSMALGLAEVPEGQDFHNGNRFHLDIQWRSYNGDGGTRISTRDIVGGPVTLGRMLIEMKTKRAYHQHTRPFITGDRLSWTLNLRRRRLCFQYNGRDVYGCQLSDDLEAIARGFSECHPFIILRSEAMLGFPWTLLEISGDESGEMPGTLPLSTPHRCILDEGDNDDITIFPRGECDQSLAFSS